MTTKLDDRYFCPVQHMPGVTLRQWMAAHLASGDIVRKPSERPSGNDNGNVDTYRQWANDVIRLTDALLAALEGWK
jgi:hypothetical protein